MDSEADIFGEGFWKDFLPATDEVRHKMLQDVLAGKKNKELTDAFYALTVSLLRAYGYNNSEAEFAADMPCKSYAIRKSRPTDSKGEKVFFPNVCFVDHAGLHHGVKLMTQGKGGSVAVKFTFFAMEGRLNLDGAMYMVTDGQEYFSERKAFQSHIDVLNTKVNPDRAPSVFWCSVAEFCSKLAYFLQFELMVEAESSLKEAM
jgi:hypothetical protein